MKKLFSVLFILPLAFGCSVAQQQSKYSNLITEESSKNHLTILASKEYEGRGTGQKGGKMAAEYIANEFKTYGLKPIVNGSSYFQPLSLVKTGYNISNFKIGDLELKNAVDFYVQGSNNTQIYSSNEIVFIGYGLQDQKYNELSSVNIQGKVVLLINEGEPTNSKGESLITGTNSKSEWTTKGMKRLQELVKLNPKMILASSSQTKQTLEKYGNRLTGGRFSIDDGKDLPVTTNTIPPVVNITEETLKNILAKANISLNQFKEKAASGVQNAITIPLNVNAEMGNSKEKFADPNVLGFLEGTDLKDEVLVICGHYDHDGILPDGTFFPGADDNGSGTVAVIELAKAFSKAKKDRKGPRRSILFIGLAAEEKGLLGSSFYVENPIIELSKTVACLNVDMIGRIDDKHLEGDHNYIHVIGVNKLSTDLKPIVELSNKDIQMKLDYDYDHPNEPMRLYYRSDHYNFAKKGIPSLFFFSGLHPHYHTTEDTVDKIDFPMMVKREKLIFNTAWEIANRDKKPVVDMPLENVGKR